MPKGHPIHKQNQFQLIKIKEMTQNLRGGRRLHVRMHPVGVAIQNRRLRTVPLTGGARRQLSRQRVQRVQHLPNSRCDPDDVDTKKSRARLARHLTRCTAPCASRCDKIMGRRQLGARS